MGSQLSAGVARIDITPPVGIPHANWGAQTHQQAQGIDLPLWATALALSDGDETVVIVDVDIINIREPEMNRCLETIAERTGLPISKIRISFTHTHSGPTGTSGRASWTTAGTEMVPSYQESLQHKIGGVAWQAVQNLQPAKFETGSGSSSIAVNRRFARPEDGVIIVGRNWDGIVDQQLNVIRIDSESGEPLAAVVNYACHPITVGPDGTEITPDYPGVVKRVVEQSTGATCLFLQGATGDIGPIRGGAKNGPNEYRRLGTILGLDASSVWWQTEVPRREERYTGTLESGAPLAIYEDDPVARALPSGTSMIRTGTRQIDVPVKQFRPADELEAEFEEHFAELNRLRETGGSDDDIRQQTMLCKRSSMRASLARQNEGRTHLPITAQAFVLGNDTVLIAIPGEPFVDIGLQVKAGSPFAHTLFSGYSNSGGGYMPMARDYPLGGYEVEVSPYSEDSAQVIIDGCLELLHDLAT